MPIYTLLQCTGAHLCQSYSNLSVTCHYFHVRTEREPCPQIVTGEVAMNVSLCAEKEYFMKKRKKVKVKKTGAVKDLYMYNFR